MVARPERRVVAVAVLWGALASLAGCPGGGDLCTNVVCGAGRYCYQGTCLWEDPCDPPCAKGQTCSSGTCVDTTSAEPDGGGSWLPGDLGDGGLADDASAADLLAPDTSPPDADVGRWYQANRKECGAFCGTVGRASAPGPEGAHCASGEVRPQSAVDQGIAFTYGCWPSCTPSAGPMQANSAGVNCYKPGQKRDGDSTDATVGCFCK